MSKILPEPTSKFLNYQNLKYEEEFLKSVERALLDKLGDEKDDDRVSSGLEIVGKKIRENQQLQILVPKEEKQIELLE